MITNPSHSYKKGGQHGQKTQIDSTYMIYDVDTNEVIYVGKGTGQRRYARTKHRSEEFLNAIRYRDVKSRIVESNLTNEEALQKEINQVKTRKEEGHPLCNKNRRRSRLCVFSIKPSVYT